MQSYYTDYKLVKVNLNNLHSILIVWLLKMKDLLDQLKNWRKKKKHFKIANNRIMRLHSRMKIMMKKKKEIENKKNKKRIQKRKKQIFIMSNN